MANTGYKDVNVRDATEHDLQFMNEVYNWNIINTTGILYTSPLTDEYRLWWFRGLKSKSIKGEPYPCLIGLVKESDGRFARFGYVCYLPWGVEGEEFEHVAKISIYVAQAYTGLGLGKHLLAAILSHQSTKQLRGLVASFPNTGSLAPGSKLMKNASSPTELSVDDAIRAKTICRDIQTDDLLEVNAIHNARRYYFSANSFEKITNIQERRLWYEHLSNNSDFPRPAILAEKGGKISGYAYLAPISQKPGFRFSMGIHLAAFDESTAKQLIIKILSHPLVKPFRTVSICEPIVQVITPSV
ncbi:GNAT family acetyltransferase [Ceratobasidium sp. AG-Ba]|nr:GNAT family acetyltransferase [Ceratobasidium sp. AG-Ba]